MLCGVNLEGQNLINTQVLMCSPQHVLHFVCLQFCGVFDLSQAGGFLLSVFMFQIQWSSVSLFPEIDSSEDIWQDLATVVLCICFLK